MRVEGLDVCVKGVGRCLFGVWVGCDAGDGAGMCRDSINAHGRGQRLVGHRNLHGDLGREDNAGSGLPLVIERRHDGE